MMVLSLYYLSWVTYQSGVRLWSEAHNQCFRNTVRAASGYRVGHRPREYGLWSFGLGRLPMMSFQDACLLPCPFPSPFSVLDLFKWSFAILETFTLGHYLPSWLSQNHPNQIV